MQCTTLSVVMIKIILYSFLWTTSFDCTIYYVTQDNALRSLLNILLEYYKVMLCAILLLIRLGLFEGQEYYQKSIVKHLSDQTSFGSRALTSHKPVN